MREEYKVEDDLDFDTKLCHTILVELLFGTISREVDILLHNRIFISWSKRSRRGFSFVY